MNNDTFAGTNAYWNKRYKEGGNSGKGSYGFYADIKNDYINRFIKTHGIQSVIEFGCGDGNVLAKAEYPRYIGLDIAKGAIQLCKEQYKGDKTKSFFWYDPDAFVDNHGVFLSDLALSLEVIFHLVEYEVFDAYMRNLFAASSKYVIILSSDDPNARITGPHVVHRKFTDWIATNRPDFKQIDYLEHPEQEINFSNFYAFEKNS